MNDTMQFRDYIFDHNPAKITVTRAEKAVRQFSPGRGEILQHLGRMARVVRCEGSFFGDSFATASARLDAFRRRAEGEEPGALFVPGEEPFLAYLQEFVFEAAGDGRIIPYAMTFLEAME